jgi:predicted transcriptional regulator YdeE
VVGISTRTTNAKEMSGKGVIAQQWDRFMKEGLLSKIPNKVDSNILAVYTDYESDANGAYTYVIGAASVSLNLRVCIPESPLPDPHSLVQQRSSD